MARRRISVGDIKEILVQWDAGEDISSIARSLGYSRGTVRKYVRAASEAGLERGRRRRGEASWERLAVTVVNSVRLGPRPGKAQAQVARFHDYIGDRLGEVCAAVLYQRLCDEHGLSVSWATFYRYVRSRWPDRMRSSPRVTVRLPDPPAGEEAQVDFLYLGKWDDPESGKPRRVHALLMTLSHSRHQFLYPVLSEDGESWLEGHVAAFSFFGGVPRRLVPDNLTAGIRRADRYDPRLNRAYGELSRYYGCLVDPSRVARPQDKPRVERSVSYARASFFRGQSFQSLAQMRSAAARWCMEVAGQRQHGTTGEMPLEAFRSRELSALQPLPPQPWEPVAWTSGRVHSDCHLHAGGARYSVPYRHVGERLDVRIGRRTVEIYDGPELVTTHTRRMSGRATRTDHYPDAGKAFLRATPKVCRERARAVGPSTARLVEDLLETPALYRLREAQNLLRLLESYQPERVEQACDRALTAGDGRLRTVRGLLSLDLERAAEEPLEASTGTAAYLRGPEAVTRTLGEVQ